MIIYTVHISFKEELSVDKLKAMVRKHIGTVGEEISYQQDAEDILAYRIKQGDWNIDTFLVLSKGQKLLTINISAPCDRTGEDVAKHMPKLIEALFKDIPYFVKNDYLSSFLPFSFGLTDAFRNRCKEMMCGRGKGSLPMVYISSFTHNTAEQKYAVDPERLANMCAGLACIVTQDSTWSSYELREKAGSRNAHHGRIGIYYPHVLTYDSIYACETDDPAELEYLVFDIVRTWWLNSAENEYSWGRLQVMKERQMATAEKGEAKELVEAFEREIEEAKAENERLRNELQIEKDRRFSAEQESDRLWSQSQWISKGSLLDVPDFEEWYKGEFSDTVTDILRDELTRRTFAEGRVAEILSALIEKNPQISDREKYLDEMATAIRQADGTEKLLNVLTRYGWKVISKTPHIKIQYRGNPRYQITLASTPSDKRERDNFIRDIMKRISPRRA